MNRLPSCLPLTPPAPLILSVFRGRSLDRPPSPRLRVSVAIPAHREVEALAACLRALANQTDLRGMPLDPACFEIILLVNNSSDGSTALAHRFADRHPELALHIVDLTLAPEHAHVGWARRLAMDEAFDRFRLLDRSDGVIATTDADTLVAPDWIARTLAEMEQGADAVGGRLMVFPAGLLKADPQLWRATVMHRRYEALADRLASLADPDPFDTWPRHGDHGGASLAATAAAYLRAGRLPPLPSGEDKAFYRALRSSGARFRHSPEVRVFTSDRLQGRAPGGMAATLSRWRASLSHGAGILVECPDAMARRLRSGAASADLVPLPAALPMLARTVTALGAS